MAVEESIAYMSGTTGGGFFMPAEELVRVSGHMVMGGISGFAVGWAILRLRRWPVVLPGCFAAALTLHFGWDWIVLAFEHNPAPAPVLGSASLMLAGLAMYGSLAAIGSEKSRAIFAADGPSRLWGWPFRRSR
jgi:RsiW-degrading membrane proteinase PrsW (M82 family)